MKKTMKSLAMIITAAVLFGGCDSGKSGKSMLPYTTPIVAAGGSAALKSLEVVNFTISPAFAPEVTEYTLVVKKSETSSVAVRAIASSGAAVTVALNDLTPAAVSPSDYTAPVALDATRDVNTITVNVTSEDGAATMAYLVRIYYYGTSASLSGLAVAVTAGSLGGMTANLAPSFDPVVTDYAAGISCYVSCLDVTVNLPDGSGMTAAVNGWTAVSGVAVPITALPEDDTAPGTITITVTSQDKSSTKNYTISVTRGPSPSPEAHLKNLVIRSYRLYNGKTGITARSWGEEVLTPAVTPERLLLDLVYTKIFTAGLGTYQPYQFQILATPLNNAVSSITGLVSLNGEPTTGFTFTKGSDGVYMGEVTGPTDKNGWGQTYGLGLTEAYLDVTAEDGTVVRYKVTLQVN